MTFKQVYKQAHIQRMVNNTAAREVACELKKAKWELTRHDKKLRLIYLRIYSQVRTDLTVDPRELSELDFAWFIVFAELDDQYEKRFGKESKAIIDRVERNKEHYEKYLTEYCKNRFSPSNH